MSICNRCAVHIVQYLRHPAAVLLPIAAPSVIAQSHHQQRGAGQRAGPQRHQLVVVEAQPAEAGQLRGEAGGQRGQLVVVEGEQLQPVEAEQLVPLQLDQLVVAEMQLQQGGQAQEGAVAQTWRL